MTNSAFTTDDRSTEFKLTPVFMEIRNRDYNFEEPVALMNADEVVQAVVSGGHPNGVKLLNDYTRIIRELMKHNPQMLLYEAKTEAIRGLLEELYDIKFEAVDEHGFYSIPV